MKYIITCKAMDDGEEFKYCGERANGFPYYKYISENDPAVKFSNRAEAIFIMKQHKEMDEDDDQEFEYNLIEVKP